MVDEAGTRRRRRGQGEADFAARLVVARHGQALEPPERGELGVEVCANRPGLGDQVGGRAGEDERRELLDPPLRSGGGPIKLCSKPARPAVNLRTRESERTGHNGPRYARGAHWQLFGHPARVWRRGSR